MEKSVIITNGTGTVELINDTYTVSAEVTGYDDTSLNPTSINVEPSTDTYAFTISATGSLTLHVTEDGTASGTPIVGATFVRTDSAGTAYGTEITTDAQGDATFENVPFAESEAPTVYFRQTASDGDHEFVETIQNTTLSTSSETLQIQNAPGATRTINLTDANYANLPVTGTLNLTN